MSISKVSTKYQVVIPKEAREKLHIKKGQEIAMIVKGGTISMVPVRPLRELRGFAKGMDVRGLREKQDRI